ncbi:MAG: GMC oxidoreductase, partial [Leptospira sp.]|nr:GMC oxidoreductase [Leptospira sp.]
IVGETPDKGVIDLDNHVFGYENLYVCDASMLTVNLGVNPSLTITALSERAMSKIPKKDSLANVKYFKFETKRGFDKIMESQPLLIATPSRKKSIASKKMAKKLTK